MKRDAMKEDPYKPVRKPTREEVADFLAAAREAMEAAEADTERNDQ